MRDGIQAAEQCKLSPSAERQPESEIVPWKSQARVRQMLVAAAREKAVLTYSDALARLGTRFTRPSMRAMCKTIGDVDRAFRAEGKPELAVLVVSQETRQPGAGWWNSLEQTAFYAANRDSSREEIVKKLQAKAFRYWRKQKAGAT